MFNTNPNAVFRGDILRVTSVTDTRYSKHVGDDYWLVRVTGGKDKDVAGNEVGTMRYAYNLVNTDNGKARITDNERLFVSPADGINQGLPLHQLEQHFKMRFRHITTERTIAPEVNRAIQVEKHKGDANANAVMLLKGLAALLGAGLLAGTTHADTLDVRDYTRIIGG